MTNKTLPTDNEFIPINDLEVSLVEAVNSGNDTHKFLRILLDSKIYYPLFGSSLKKLPKGRTTTLKAGMHLSMKFVAHGGANWLAIFTDPSRIWQSTAETHVAAHDLCRDLFQRCPDQSFILNFGSKFGRTITSTEVKIMLEGRWDNISGSRSIPAGTKMRVGQPATYPLGLLEGLSRGFTAIPEITAAYAPMIQIGDAAPKIVIEILSNSSSEDLQGRVHEVAKSAVGNDAYLDFAYRRVASELFSSGDITPFYSKPNQHSLFNKLIRRFSK